MITGEIGLRTVVRAMLCALLFSVSSAAVPARADGPDTTWLCAPGRSGDPCGGNSGAPIDCFYVYPTISLQPTPNSDTTAGPEESGMARMQAAPFGQACNVWAPMYRQSTLLSLFTASGPDRSAALDLAYEDIGRAWDDYLAHHNGGRGVVLIGHSQGTSLLRSLIRNRIDSQDVESRLVSAILLGGNVLVPKGEVVGGDFSSVPACTESGQLGCVVAFSAVGTTPPADTRYGYPPAEAGGSAARGALPFGPDYEVLCTNPASLADNDRATVHSILDGIRTDRYTARCTTGDGPHLLVIEGGVPPASSLPTVPNPTWGLHLLDMNVAQGDLVDLVAAQSREYVRVHGN